jgi:N-acetylmuramoyl-L-alanine amidase
VSQTGESRRHLLTRRELIGATTVLLQTLGASRLLLGASPKSFLISNRLSPLNRKRPRRPNTRYIVLHTTEGEEEGSLEKIMRFGEAHYVVLSSGQVYRVIDKGKIAKHAGRSMWEGRKAIDNYSIGIEVVGYHNREPREAQYRALRELLRQLKDLYGITDENILTHSMVAYGRPNRFHNENHRGRKRCGMVLARPEVRARLGLTSKPDHDPDVAGGRLAVGDNELFRFLFARRAGPAMTQAARGAETTEIPPESIVIDSNWTAWKIARERYNHPSTTYLFPDGRRIAGDQIENWNGIPNGTRVLLNGTEDNQPFEGFLEIGKDGDNPKAIAGKAWKSNTTIYFFPDGFIRTGAELESHRSGRKLLEDPPKGTRLLVGYVYGGHVKSRRPPASIAGQKWNYPSTYYRYPNGSIVSGDEVESIGIPASSLVFYQR